MRQREFTSTHGTAAAARRWAQDVMASMGADPRSIDDVSLALSELASNLVQHGRGSVITVSLDDPPGWWELHVRGGSLPVTEPAHWDVAPPDRPDGRGLGIVRTVMDEVSVDDSTNTVSCRLARR